MRDTLKRLKLLDRPIRVATIGIGSAGKGIFYQSGITPGIACVGIADNDISKAVAAAEAFARPYRVVQRSGEIEDAVASGLVAVCEDGELLARCQSADVLVDASTAMADGGRFALAAIDTGKHLVMMNSEADLMFGPYLMRRAEERALVYTSCDGDQPGCARRLIDDLQLWGFELVMAGNIKGFLDRYADPTTIIPEAEKRLLDPKMCASYTDGTKLCVEMALLANALDLVTTVPGMQGPRAERVTDVFRLFDLDAIRATGKPVVDYILGSKPPGGVFAIGYCESAYQQSMLNWFPPDTGSGPYYVFERPYHLVHIEAMKCIAEAFLDREALLQPAYGFKTDVYAYAKRDLHKGERLDGIGGYACYGLIENLSEEDALGANSSGIPICLAEGLELTRDVAKDQRLSMDDVSYDSERLEWKLYTLARAERPRGEMR